MSSDLRPDAPPPGPSPALTLAELPGWRDRLAGPDPMPDPGSAPFADAAGLQVLVAALRWAPGRVSLDPADGSPAADLWRRLGLDDPADAEPVAESGRIGALRPLEGARP